MESTTAEALGKPIAKTVIEPAAGWPHPNLREIWSHRDLIYFLARRDLVIVYKQASIGIFWAVLQPVLLTVVFAVFFGVLQKVESIPGVPYPLLVISGFTVWLAFTRAVNTGSMSTTGAESLIGKVYFPRMTIPIAAVLPATVEFAIGLVVFIGAALIYGFVPGPEVILSPIAWGMALTAALGFVLWFSALNVAYRDFALVVPFLLLVGMFITPIAYPLDTVPENIKPLMAVNPMVGVLEFFRWSVLGTAWPGLKLIGISGLISIFLVVTGAYYYRHAEPKFADII